LLVGGSLFRRVDFTNSFAGFAELFVAYDLQTTTWHSSMNLDGSAAVNTGRDANYDHRARVLFRANMGFKGEKTLYHGGGPYIGYQAGSCGSGVNVGADF